MKVRIREAWDRAAVDVWFYVQDELQDGRVLTRVAKPVALQFEPRPGNEGAFLLPEPTLQIPQKEARAFFTGLAEGLAEMGYRTSSDRLAGEHAVLERFLKREQEQGDRTFRLLEDAVAASLRREVL